MRVVKFLAVAALAACAVASCKNMESENSSIAEVTIKGEYGDIQISEGLRDSVAYAFGLSLGLNEVFSSMDEFNMEAFRNGMSDAIAIGVPDDLNPYFEDTTWTRKFKISPYEINAVVNKYVIECVEASEEAYFSKIESEVEGVQSTESGLRYVLHAEGEGDLVDLKDTVVVNYKGTLTDGTKFDANDSIQFITSQMIPGFTEGLTKMKKGAKATFYIPSKLGYGQRPPYGSNIKPNSILVFEVDMVDVKKAEVQQ